MQKFKDDLIVVGSGSFGMAVSRTPALSLFFFKAALHLAVL